MGISILPPQVSPIKSVQRGTAVSSGNISISSVDISKTTVRSFSTGSAGTVSIAGATTSGMTGSISGFSTNNSSFYVSGYTAGLGGSGSNVFGGGYSTAYGVFAAMNANGSNWDSITQNLTGGTTNLVAKQYGAYLVNSTTITVTGPCRYEVIEYY